MSINNSFFYEINRISNMYELCPDALRNRKTFFNFLNDCIPENKALRVDLINAFEEGIIDLIMTNDDVMSVTTICLKRLINNCGMSLKYAEMVVIVFFQLCFRYNFLYELSASDDVFECNRNIKQLEENYKKGFKKVFVHCLDEAIKNGAIERKLISSHYLWEGIRYAHTLYGDGAWEKRQAWIEKYLRYYNELYYYYDMEDIPILEMCYVLAKCYSKQIYRNMHISRLEKYNGYYVKRIENTIKRAVNSLIDGSQRTIYNVDMLYEIGTFLYYGTILINECKTIHITQDIKLAKIALLKAKDNGNDKAADLIEKMRQNGIEVIERDRDRNRDREEQERISYLKKNKDILDIIKNHVLYYSNCSRVNRFLIEVILCDERKTNRLVNQYIRYQYYGCNPIYAVYYYLWYWFLKLYPIEKMTEDEMDDFIRDTEAYTKERIINMDCYKKRPMSQIIIWGLYMCGKCYYYKYSLSLSTDDYYQIEKNWELAMDFFVNIGGRVSDDTLDYVRTIYNCYRNREIHWHGYKTIRFIPSYYIVDKFEDALSNNESEIGDLLLQNHDGVELENETDRYIIDDDYVYEPPYPESNYIDIREAVKDYYISSDIEYDPQSIIDYRCKDLEVVQVDESIRFDYIDRFYDVYPDLFYFNSIK